MEEKNESLSYSQLMWRIFKKHKLAVGASWILIFFYIIALSSGFFALREPNERNLEYIFAPPQTLHFVDSDGKIHIRPFVYGYSSYKDPETWERIYKIDKDKREQIYFIVRGKPYKLLGLIKTNIHLFGVEGDTPLYPLGTDELGRCVYSMIIYGSRISLSIGLIGVFLSLILGLLIGGVSGLFGGVVDLIIQRFIEILRSIPRIPLWMALSAALPSDWSPLKIYFAITILLSLVGWTSVARIVRGKFLSLRNEDFVLSSKSMGANEWWIITRHLIPNFMSYIMVTVTLSIPGMILAETSLSFLGIGLRPPVISWGVLLQQAQNMRTVSLHPWLLLPGLFVVIIVLAYNFVGDGLRDAADPYAN